MRSATVVSLDAFYFETYRGVGRDPDLRRGTISRNKPEPGEDKVTGKPQSGKKPAYCYSFAYRFGAAAETFGSTGKKFAIGGLVAGGISAVSGFGIGLAGVSASAYGASAALQLAGQGLKNIASGHLNPPVVGGMIGQALSPAMQLTKIGGAVVDASTDAVTDPILSKIEMDPCQ